MELSMLIKPNSAKDQRDEDEYGKQPVKFLQEPDHTMSSNPFMTDKSKWFGTPFLIAFGRPIRLWRELIFNFKTNCMAQCYSSIFKNVFHFFNPIKCIITWQKSQNAEWRMLSTTRQALSKEDWRKLARPPIRPLPKLRGPLIAQAIKSVAQLRKLQLKPPRLVRQPEVK